MQTNKYQKNMISNIEVNVEMTKRAPSINPNKRRVENVRLEFDNPGEVVVETPVLTCEKTGMKFIHPEDLDEFVDKLEVEYNRVNETLKTNKSE